MSSILCLAHFCDTHGPTPLMVTEALPAGCTSCFEDESATTRRPSTASRSLAAITRGTSRTNSMSSEKENGTRPHLHTSLSQSQSQSPSAIETPPESPRVAALQNGQFGSLHRRDSSYRKTYDENDKKRASPCDNCSLTLPPKNSLKEDSSPGYNDINGPILRTRRIYERVSGPVEHHPSPPKSECSSSSESDNAVSSKPTHGRTRSRTLMRIGTTSSSSSFKSTDSHEHYVDYTSSHEPLHQTSFSILRQSCLRTLSCETLPPSTLQQTSSPTSPFSNSPWSNPANIPSGGPIVFGDSLAGWTTAYKFRIPDPNARGRRRVYALIALSTHKQRAVMKGFRLVSEIFCELAAWIQSLAEAELERSETLNSPRVSNNDFGGGMSGASTGTPTSAFLTGRNRGFDGGQRMVMKARGLAEIVGMPDFFIELHARFVQLLVRLNYEMGI